MKKRIKRGLEIAGGGVLVLAGFSLGFVPFLPGFPLFFSGLVFISPHHGRKFFHCLKNSWRQARRGKMKKAWDELLQFIPARARLAKMARKLRKIRLKKRTWKERLHLERFGKK